MLKKTKPLVWLIPLVIGLFFRLNHLSNISFSYDQARDAFISQEIIQGHLKIVGPPTDLQVVFHGPLYYYVLAPLYALSLDPRFVVVIFTLLNLSAAVAVGLIIHRHFKSKLASWMGMVLFAISPELIFYGRFISNVSLAIPCLAWGLYFLDGWKNSKYLALSAFLFGLAAQAEFFLLSLSFIVFLFLLIKKADIRKILLFIFTYSLAISPYFLAEIKFNFRGLKKILEFTGEASTLNLFELWNRIDAAFSGLFSRNLFPVSGWIGLFIVVVALLLVYRKFHSLFWFYLLFVVSLLPLLIYAYPGPIFFTIGALIPLIIIISSLFKTAPVLGILIFLLVAFFNLPLNFRGVETNTVFTGSETGMILSDEMALVDSVYQYQPAKSSLEISYNSITSPLYVNTTWAYLFNWYGRSKYGFVPFWHGQDQIGRPGVNTLTSGDGKEKIDLLIIETRVPDHWQKQLIEKESFRAAPFEEKQFGRLKLIIANRLK